MPHFLLLLQPSLVSCGSSAKYDPMWRINWPCEHLKWHQTPLRSVNSESLRTWLTHRYICADIHTLAVIISDSLTPHHLTYTIFPQIQQLCNTPDYFSLSSQLSEITRKCKFANLWDIEFISIYWNSPEMEWKFILQQYFFIGFSFQWKLFQWQNIKNIKRILYYNWTGF